MSEPASAESDRLVVTTPNGPIDPVDYDTLIGFKYAVYQYGAGSWVDDYRLAKLYDLAHERDAEEASDAL